jgi:hypothetical protein
MMRNNYVNAFLTTTTEAEAWTRAQCRALSDYGRETRMKVVVKVQGTVAAQSGPPASLLRKRLSVTVLIDTLLPTTDPFLALS